MKEMTYTVVIHGRNYLNGSSYSRTVSGIASGVPPSIQREATFDFAIDIIEEIKREAADMQFPESLTITMGTTDESNTCVKTSVD